MYGRNRFHQHFPSHRPSVFALMGGMDRGVRFKVDDGDGGDGAGSGSGGSGGGTGGGSAQVVFPSQEALDAVIKERVSRAKETVRREITDKYGDLDALKAKAESTEGADAVDALNGILKALGVEAGKDGTALKDLVNKATSRATDLAKVEADKAEADAKAVRTKIATDFGLKPETADFLKGATEDELKASAKQMADLMGVKVPEGQGGQEGQGTGAGTGGTGGTNGTDGTGGTGDVGKGTNPGTAGTGTPANLSEAIGAHYK